MITESLVVAVATPAIKSFVEKSIVPKFEKFLKSADAKTKELLNQNDDYFEEYYQRMYDKYSYVNTMVFHNSQRLLKDIYVAQTLVKENSFGEKKESKKINRFPVKLIKKYKRILITDTAGMGKSTITKRMFIDLIDNGIEGVGVPIYIELNRLNKGRSIIEEIHEELSSLSKEFNKELLVRFIQTGGFIFFLDGYDEIQLTDRNKVTEDIRGFITRAGTNNYYILTSRLDDGLACFGDFQSFNIQPLSKQEAYDLLKKYDLSKKKELSGKLVKLLKSGHYDSIDEYLKSPLLVSLLYAAFDHKQDIPWKKHLFFRQVYDALYDAHKLAQGHKPHEKRSVLDIDDFNRVLRYIGYECLIKIGVQFDKDTILKSIDRAKNSCRKSCRNLDFSSNDFFKDLMTSVPLFTKDGTEYKWAHISLMEYFAARYIADDLKEEEQDKVLTAIYKSKYIDNYLNMLDIYFDIDYSGFSRNIILPSCEKYIMFYEQSKSNLKINKKLVDNRVGLLYLFKDARFGVVNRDKIVRIDDVLSNMGFITNYICYQLSLTSDAFLFTEVDKHYYLLQLLRKRIPSLYIKQDEYKLSNDMDLEETLSFYKIDDFRNKDNFEKVDTETGNNNTKVYIYINELLLRITNQDMDYMTLNYKACIAEMDSIHKIINQKKSSDLLLPS